MRVRVRRDGAGRVPYVVGQDQAPEECDNLRVDEDLLAGPGEQGAVGPGGVRDQAHKARHEEGKVLQAIQLGHVQPEQVLVLLRARACMWRPARRTRTAP